MSNEANEVMKIVKWKILKLIESRNDSVTRATLANLRKGIGKQPGSLPTLWDITFSGIPVDSLSKDSEPTKEEWAIHTCLTLFALHQQGKDIEQQCMSKEGEFLGISLRKLIASEEDEKRIKRRFDAASTADSLKEFSFHLRGLIQILRSENLPLDYPMLAKELFLFQIPDARDSIRLKWGRDFYRYKSDNTFRKDDLIEN